MTEPRDPRSPRSGNTRLVDDRQPRSDRDREPHAIAMIRSNKLRKVPAFRPAFAGDATSASLPDRLDKPALRGNSSPQNSTHVLHTHAESFYYQKQIQAKTPLTLILEDGETVHGVLEWYDRDCLKLNAEERGHLLVYKCAIKYLYKKEV